MPPHQHEMPPPVGDQAARHDPEEPVVLAHVGTPLAAQRDGELLSQEQVLQQQRMAAPERPAEDTNEQ